MAQTVRVFVTDFVTLAPIEDAAVALHNVSTGDITYTTTDSSGKATAILPEGVYTITVSKPGYLTLSDQKLEVIVPKPASPAIIEGQANVSLPQIGPAHKNIELSVDGGSFVLIDVTGGDDTAVSVGEIVNNINTALGTTVATELIGGRLRLTSPTTGSSSQLVLKNDGSTPSSAVEQLFGFAEGSGDIVETGTDSNPYSNDFDVQLEPRLPASPRMSNGCVVYGYLYDQASNPLYPFTFHANILEVPRAVDSSRIKSLFGDSIYISTEPDGFFSVELIRKSKVLFYFPNHDKVIEVVIPDAPQANLISLLTPFLTDLYEKNVGTGTIELSVGDNYTLSIIGKYSDGSEEPLLEFTATSLDDNVAAFLNPENPRLLTGVSAGTTQVSVAAVSDTGETITRIWTVVVT